MAEAAGPLVIIGGHEDHEGDRVILREIARRLEGRTLLVCAAASRTPADYVETYRAAFDGLGVEVRELVPEPNAQARLAEAGGVFFSGGDQNRLMGRLDAAHLTAALRSFSREGGLLAGTSAGASVMSERMLSHGPSGETPDEADVELAGGIGVLPGVLIDQHFAERGRMGRLASGISRHPEMIGIGIDEDTAAIVEAGMLTAVGTGGVNVLTSVVGGQAEGERYDLRILRATETFDLRQGARSSTV